MDLSIIIMVDQIFLDKDDELLIYANVDHNKKLIIIDEYYYYIKYLKE